jgi:hypothetical protein
MNIGSYYNVEEEAAARAPPRLGEMVRRTAPTLPNQDLLAQLPMWTGR